MPVTGPSRLCVRRGVGPGVAAVRVCGWVLVLLLAGRSVALGQVDVTASITNPPPPTDDDFKKNTQLKYNEALKSNQLDRLVKELLDKGIHYRVAQIQATGQESNRARNIKRLIDELRAANTAPNARQYASEQVIARCQQIFNDPRADARVAACHLLAQLNASWNPDIPFVPTTDTFLQTFSFPDDKYIQVKVVAANGLARILRDAPSNLLPVLKRLEIAEKISAELVRLQESRGQPSAASAVGQQWAMWSLVTALGYADRTTNQAQEPVIVDALQKVLYDRKADWLARAKAAEALSRLPYEGTANLSLLNYEVARLLHDAAQQYNTELAAGRPGPMWRRVALHIYMTYEGQNQAARTLNIGLTSQVNRSGLAGHKAQIDAVRALMIPIVNAWIQTPAAQPIPADAINNLATWLNANTLPADAKLVPTSTVKPPAAAEATPAAGPGT